MFISGRVTALLRGSGPPAALSTAQVFEEHVSFAWRVLRRLGIAEADADDVCQEVFVVVHRKLPHFAGESSVRTWVYGICLRVASDHKRLAHVRREVATDVPPEGSVDPVQEDTAALRQACARLDAILDTLDDTKRAVFVLYELEELTMADVALAIGCPLQTAYSRLHAARRAVEAAVALARDEGATP
jgi:RNA polymerase sigma-70 factor (ECF subfamily)